MRPLISAIACSILCSGVAVAQPPPQSQPASPPKAAASSKPEPTKEQTEEWLKQHIEAWNEANIEVMVKDCRIVVDDRKRARSEVINLRGLLLPIEVIRLPGAADATFRLRVRDKHSGTYAMFRTCDEQNRFCKDATGKFQAQPWVDLTMTSVTDFIAHPHTTDARKVERLVRALELYSRLCGAMEDARSTLF